MVVPKNLSQKYKPLFLGLNRIDVFGYLFPAFTIIIIFDCLLLFAGGVSILITLIVTIVLLIIVLLGLIKVFTIRLYYYCLWIMQWVVLKKKRNHIFFKELFNIKDENIKDNTITKKAKDSRQSIYKEIYEISADSINFLFDIKQESVINKFTNFFKNITEPLTIYSIPCSTDYSSQIAFMKQSFEDTYHDKKASNIIKYAKINEMEMFSRYFVDSNAKFKIFLVFHSQNPDNKRLIGQLNLMGIQTKKISKKQTIETLTNIFTLQDFNQKDVFSYDKTEIKFNINNFEVSKHENGKMIKNYGRFFCINNLPNEVGFTWLASLFNIEASFSLKVKPVDVIQARRQLNIGLINARVDMEKSKNEHDKLKYQLEYEILEEQFNAVVGENDRMFKISLIGKIDAVDAKQLTEKTKDVFSKIRIKNFDINTLIGQQEKAYSSFAMKKNDYLPNSINIFIGTKALGYSYPFSNDNIQDSTGYYLGANVNNEPMIIDFSKYDKYKEDPIRNSANGIVLGKIGSGKSYFTKKLIKNELLCDNWEVNVIDPDGEYQRMVNNFNGKYYEMSKYTINPFDIWLTISSSDDDNQSVSNDIAINHVNKLDGFFSNLFPSFTIKEKNILFDYIKDLYKQFKIDLNYINLNTIKKLKLPILDDLYNLILKEFEKNYKGKQKDILFDKKDAMENILLHLKPYTSLGNYYFLWNGQTNLDINQLSKFNVFDIKNLLNFENKNIFSTQFFLIIKFLQFRIINNRSEQENRIANGLKPNLYISLICDEFHKLTRENNKLLKYLIELYKTIRKYFGNVWTISQDLTDWSQYEDSKKIINQSIFKFIFQLDSNAIDDLEILFKNNGGLSDYEKLQIIDASQGECLLIYDQKRMLLQVVADQNFESKLWEKDLTKEIDKYKVQFDDL